MPELGRRPLTAQYRFAALGTQWRIASPNSFDPDVRQQIDARVECFDAAWSRFRADSLVGRMAQESGTYLFPPEAPAVMSLYRSVYELTDGRVTPTPLWDEVLTSEGRTFTTTAPMVLDIGAAGKGMLVDLLGELIDPGHRGGILIDASGDLLHRGPMPCRVGLEHPLDPTMVIGVAELGDAALCSSAINRRRWGTGLHHVIDPFTGEPVSGTLATWVVAETTALADILATALFFVEPSVLAARYAFSYVRMAEDGSVDYSTDFPGELFL